MLMKYSKQLCPAVLSLAMAATPAWAQWGTNALPCSNGSCAPTANWGYHPTCWRRWPGAIYPDMQPLPQSRQPEGIQPPLIETPPAEAEADVRPPSPTR